MSDRDYVTTAEAEALTGVRAHHWSERAKKGELPGATRAGGEAGHWLIPRQEVLSYKGRGPGRPALAEDLASGMVSTTRAAELTGVRDYLWAARAGRGDIPGATKLRGQWMLPREEVLRFRPRPAGRPVGVSRETSKEVA